MTQPNLTQQLAARVARHRRKLSARGAKRIEVIVPIGDADLIRQLAALLRSGGKAAEQVREGVKPLLQPKIAASGKELVEFFRASPLVDEDLLFERDRSPGRPVEL